MPQESPILALPFLQPSQAQKHVTHNEALQRLDVLVQLRVEAFDATDPPAVPVDGAVYALGSAPIGDWAGQGDRLAAWLDGVWQFFVPQPGWRAWGLAEAALRIWDGTGWTGFTLDSQNLDGVGIATTSDATNRLSVQAPATLLSHDGGGHQLKINKSAGPATASLLFQSAWQGHAEMGLAGNTDFTIKVSPDGLAWADALRLEADTGLATGAAVMATPDDTTPGRLVTAGGFGLGRRVLEFDAGDDLDGLRNLSALIGNPSGGALPANSPAAGAFVGLSAALDSMRGVQMLFDTLSDRVFFRTDDGGWSDWRELFHAGNLTGTVSQVGGVPTGAVIESGSNDDGDYVRFADGTQICTSEVAVDVTSTGSQTWDFPMPFEGGRRRISSSFSHVTAVPNTALEMANIQAFGHDTNGWLMRLKTAGTSSDPTSGAETLSVCATGRWFV